MFGWCGRTGTLVELSAPDGLVRVLLQIVSRSAARGKGGPHDPAVLHGVRRAGIKHRLVLDPTVFRLYAGRRIRHGDHPALSASVAAVDLYLSFIVSSDVFGGFRRDPARKVTARGVPKFTN